MSRAFSTSSASPEAPATGSSLSTTMSTLVRGGWVGGFAAGAPTLVPEGLVVYENDRIAYVGRRFEGRADAEIDARGKLVCPGFIDTHVHSGHRASHRLITD